MTSQFSDVATHYAICDATDVPTPSLGSVMVRFVNESGVVLILNWRDFNGNLVTYSQLDPDGLVDQETFVGHQWVAVDEAAM